MRVGSLVNKIPPKNRGFHVMQGQDKHFERQGWRKANFATESKGNFNCLLGMLPGKAYSKFPF